MTRAVPATLAVFLLLGIAAAQSQSPPPDAPTPQPSSRTSNTQPAQPPAPTPSSSQPPPSSSSSPSGENPDDILNAPMTPPRSDKPAEEFPFPEDREKGNYSSSKDSQGDLNPPSNDHPGNVNIPPDDVTEVKPWNPHEADKDVEVGVFYFHRGNYRAAEARFRDALHWMENNAEANYRLASVLEKEGKGLQAHQYYEAYLKILPNGPFASDSKKALARLDAEDEGSKKPRKRAATSPPS